MTARRLTVVAEARHVGIQVNTVLRKELGLSGTLLRRVKFLDDGILVNTQRVTTRYRLQLGDVLTVRLTEPQRRSDLVSAPGPLDIVYEDEDLLVLNKAPGVAVHPGPGHHDDTMGNFILNYYDQQNKEGDFHPVHRLDRGTSGLMVVARHPLAQEALKHQMQTKDFCREYLALCQGRPDPAQDTVDAPIGSVDGSLMQRMVRQDGQRAVTHYETVSRHNDLTLLRLRLETGRTHQIRVHLSWLGHPLAGDFLYGTEGTYPIARPALHSQRLQFIHPVTKAPMAFHCPLPQDIQNLLT